MRNSVQASSKKTRASVPPGTMSDTTDRKSQAVFKCITDNNHRHLEQLLAVQQNETDVTTLIERRSYTALSYAAFKNHGMCFKVILNHAMTYNIPHIISTMQKQKDLVIKEWVDMTTDEDFTALHFAVYHGNWELIQILVEELGANIEKRNVYGANVLHIAAQGDQPAPLYYFSKIKGIDINCIDKRGSTPLHWACYSKSEFALCYILAFSPDLEI